MINQSQDNNEYEQQLQIDSQISKLQNFIVYIKQITLHVSATIKDPGLREYLKSYIENFDKTIDQYNYEYLRKRMKKLLYFQIQQIAVMKDQPFFIEKITLKNKANQQCQQLYFMNLVFTKQQKTIVDPSFKVTKYTKKIPQITVYSNHYRMHVQIYKQQNQYPVTNLVLSRFQKNCINQMTQNLMERGYVNHFDGSAIVLNCKKPVYKSVNNKTAGDLMETLKALAQRFLKNMANTLIKQRVCSHCNKHYIFDNEYGVMMPPTMSIWQMKPKTNIDPNKDKQDKIRSLHQVCSLKYFKCPPLPPQFKLPQRQAQNPQLIYQQQRQQQQAQNQKN